MRIYKIIFEKEGERRFVLCDAKNALEASGKWNQRGEDIGRDVQILDIILLEVLPDGIEGKDIMSLWPSSYTQ
jgi:hypothetical protein